LKTGHEGKGETLADYALFNVQYNTNTDASPTWTGTAIAFGGSGNGANEFRFSDTGAGATTTTPSASWPLVPRPLSGTAAMRQLWMFTTDAVGLQVATYDGTNAKANVLRLNQPNTDGTFAAAPRWSAFSSSALTTPSPGTQTPSVTDGRNFINGANPDTGTSPILSYLYGNGYGSGMTNAGTQETPSAGSVGTLTIATHSAVGAATPSAGSWLATWQDLQGWIDWIAFPAIPKPVTAFFYYFTIVLFMGVTLTPGNVTFAPMVLDYSYI